MPSPLFFIYNRCDGNEKHFLFHRVLYTQKTGSADRFLQASFEPMKQAEIIA